MSHLVSIAERSPFGSGVGAGINRSCPFSSYKDVEPTTMFEVLLVSDFVLPLVELLLVNFSNFSADMTCTNPVPFSILARVICY
jgi:hypothetical protein